jgi:hypothetical protein
VSAGNCTAVGGYNAAASNSFGVVLTETSGVWGPGQELPLPANAATAPTSQYVGFTSPSSVSCTSAGNCTAVGTYEDASGNTDGLLLSETAGVWGTGVEAALPANAATSSQYVAINAVSCTSPGNCTAVGSYVDTAGNTQPLMLTETSGMWATGVEGTFPTTPAASLYAPLSSVSCTSAGNCVAVGNYQDTSHAYQGVVLTESNGTWATGTNPALPANAGTNPYVYLNSVACPSAGNCTVVGRYADTTVQPQGLLLTETAGLWGTGGEATLPSDATNSAQYAGINSVSCSSPGNCSAVGDYIPAGASTAGTMFTESAGTWTAGVAVGLPPNSNGSALDSLSCVSAGECMAGGQRGDNSGNFRGLLVAESLGVWSSGLDPPLPANASQNPVRGHIGSVSCVATGVCTAVGDYYDGSGHNQGLLLGTVATPSLALNAPGSGQSGRAIVPATVGAVLAGGAVPTGTLTFTLFGPQSTPPTSCAAGGIVSETAVVAGNGTYRPPAAFIPPKAGTYWWLASYGGDGGNRAAATSCGTGMASTVVAAPLQVSIKTGKATVSAGKTAVTLSCAGGAAGASCRGKLSLTIRKRVVRVSHHHRKVTFVTVTLASVRYSLPSGARKTFTLHLSGAGTKALNTASGHRLSVLATATLTGGKAATHTITLQARTSKPSH